ncbi:MAG: DUF2147 domain-containing protein [Gammaproteobacteria bacterium]|nr:DUF2147 domain-containing protein [Gammaproteobacteria bacterium]
MKKILLIILATFPILVLAKSLTLSQVNCWQTVSDKNGKVTSIVKTWQHDHFFYGKIIKTFKVKGLPYTNRCTLCKGFKHNKPVKGLLIIWQGHKDSPFAWSNLRILDPRTGDIYKAKATLQSNGQKLRVRGYIGIPLFGRTQVWLKTKCPIN